MTTDGFASPTDRDALLEQCRALAEAPEILREFEAELRSYGVVGATDNFKLLMLTMVTRLFDQPVSVILKGNAAAGKSYTLATVLKYIPEDGYVMVSGMSDKAVIYDEESVRHRMLCIGEYAGLQSENGNAWLRQLITEGELRYKVTAEGPDGQRVTRDLRREGPTGVVMTTTALKVHPEDETRFLSIYLDATEEQRRAILAAQARRAQGMQANKANAEPWLALHSWVSAGPCEVLVPYAGTLADQADIRHGRASRDFPKVLALIKAHALLHQRRREIDSKGRVLANHEDYAAVYALLDPVLSRADGASVSENVRVVAAAVSVLATQTNHGDSGVPQTAIVQYLHDEGLDRSAPYVSRAVNDALDEGYLVNDDAGRRSRTHRLRVGERKRRRRSSLPLPEEVTRKQGG